MSRKGIFMGIIGISLILLALAGTGGATNLTPKIVSLLPPYPTVNNQVGEMRTFSIITDQAVDVIWAINGMQVQSNTKSTTSSYINNSAQMGSWNVTTVVENANGTDMHKWDWIVKAPPPVSIEIKNFAFNPAQINVSKGTTVIWMNNESVAHTVTSDTNIFDSGTINLGQTFEWTFDQLGTFKYHCTIHPTLIGEVTVIPGPTPTPPPMEEIGIGLELVAENFTAPVALVSPEDGTGRRFIVDQIGVIKIITADGQILQEPFLNISSKIVSLNPQYDERGLLGLALHPNFSQTGRFFVYYSAPLRQEAPDNWDATSTISEFKVSQDNPNITNMSSERILLQVDKPQFNHNAGQIAFGPDGYLYIPIGDGGRADDVGIGHPPPGNGQNISTLLGKILRIDVDNGDPYGIPPDNPFVGKEGLDEIFAYGLRNPFRIAFDAGGNHSLFESDAGQNSWEEVNIVTKGGNYGWNIKEGTHCFDPNNPNLASESCPNVSASGQLLIDPIIEYANAGQPGGLGVVVIGGSVYRGNSLPQFNGTYIFGDFSKGFTEGNGSLFVARQPPAGKKMWSVKELRVASRESGRIGAYVRSFGQDTDNEMYVMTSQNLGPSGDTGKVFKIKPANGQVGELKSIEISPSTTTTLTVGGTQQFMATARDQNDNPMPGINISWTSSNLTVGTVSPSYAITGPDGKASAIFSAIATGEAKIAGANGSITDSALVTVLASGEVGELKSIEISPSTTTTLTVGGTQQFMATAHDQNDNPMPGINISWTSSNLTVGTVSPSYAITGPDGKASAIFSAIATGEAKIAAENGSIADSALVTVINPSGVPEFSSIILPIVAIMGVILILSRRKK